MYAVIRLQLLHGLQALARTHADTCSHAYTYAQSCIKPSASERPLHCCGQLALVGGPRRPKLQRVNPRYAALW
jgi:hypothetical protein